MTALEQPKLNAARMTKQSFLNPLYKRALNASLFTLIAPRYECATMLLSAGQDSCWKQLLVDSLPPFPAAVIVDMACGTGALTRRLRLRYPGAQLCALDLTAAMVQQARRLLPGAWRISLVQQDMGALGLAGGSVDIITAGYALRNAPHLPTAVAECARILRPGGTLGILDFSNPVNPLHRWLNSQLLLRWGQLWGLFLHRQPCIYAYIAHSLKRFPHRQGLRRLLKQHGLHEVVSMRRFFGIIEILVVQKSSMIGHP
jgi:ubiquinone/menaquinone biosynthesis methyltransferase